MSARKTNVNLPELLREITAMDRMQCCLAWVRAFKSNPPKYLSMQFMQRVLAHGLQCRKLAGYPVATRRVLKAVLAGGDVSEAAKTAGTGSTLVREWNGRVYRVEASPEGYVLDGKTYTSLSAIARHITGARWSGPRFFGSTRKRSA